jgi:hypothetical protein
VRAPSNGFNQTCGFGGLSCANCAQSGQVCNQVTLTCMSGAGGGSAGGNPQPGDTCLDAIPLNPAPNAAVIADTGTLTGRFNDTNACSGSGPDVVYALSLSQTTLVTPRVSATGFFPRVSIRSTCSTSSTLTCAAATSSMAVNANPVTLAPGTWFVWVDSDATPVGGSNYLLSLDLMPPGTGGGGAGGGTAGGTAGGFGGGTGSYIQTAIVAACDDLSVGATDVLTPNTIPALSDDSASPVMPLPVPFPFFGSLVTHAGVQSNGMVQLFTSSSGTVSTSYTNTSIPSTGAPDGFAAPLWNDLFPDSTSAIRMRAFTTGGARLTVNWLNVAGPSTEFQAKFFATGVIEFHYCSMAGVATSSATAGVESLSGFSGTPGTFSTTLTGSGMRFTP